MNENKSINNLRMYEEQIADVLNVDVALLRYNMLALDNGKIESQKLMYDYKIDSEQYITVIRDIKDVIATMIDDGIELETDDQIEEYATFLYTYRNFLLLLIEGDYQVCTNLAVPIYNIFADFESMLEEGSLAQATEDAIAEILNDADSPLDSMMLLQDAIVEISLNYEDDEEDEDEDSFY